MPVTLPSPTKLLPWLVGVLGVLGLFYGLQEHSAAHSSDAALKLAQRAQIQLNDSTQLKFAADARAKDSLQALVTAAKQAGGKLVSGVQFTITKHDTTIVHDTLVTVVASDQGRSASWRDSTFAGIVSGTVTAPPGTAPLQLRWTIDRPAFSPQVGFVQVGNQLAAVVEWQGEHARIDNAFALPTSPAPKHIVPWAEGTYALAGAPYVSGGLALRVGHFQLGPSVTQQLAIGQHPQLGVTLRKEW